MQTGNKKELYALSATKRSVLWKSLLFVAYQFVFTAFSLYLSMQPMWYVWLIGQVLLGLNMLQWFFLLHDFGHQSLFGNKLINAILGHIASIFCLLPYYPWLHVHNLHHKWTGWRSKDPTIPAYTVEDLSPKQIKIIDFCWKYWIPIFAINYTLQTFYDLKVLKTYFPQGSKRRQNRISIGIIVICYIGFIVAAPWLFLKIWGVAFFIYISISDPMLLSQHTHLDYLDDDNPEPKTVKLIDQDKYSRSVQYPKFVEKYLFYNSTMHGLHHQFPYIPLYHLHQLPHPKENLIYWKDWLYLAKRIPGHQLIFLSFKHTGIKL